MFPLRRIPPYPSSSSAKASSRPSISVEEEATSSWYLDTDPSPGASSPVGSVSCTRLPVTPTLGAEASASVAYPLSPPALSIRPLPSPGCEGRRPGVAFGCRECAESLGVECPVLTVMLPGVGITEEEGLLPSVPYGASPEGVYAVVVAAESGSAVEAASAADELRSDPAPVVEPYDATPRVVESAYDSGVNNLDM